MVAAARPFLIPNCLKRCFRNQERTSFAGIFTKTLFGDTKQMGMMLEQMFKTKRIWIKVTNKVKLDCMFFRSNKNEGTANWLSRPTIIMCGSNAMFY